MKENYNLISISIITVPDSYRNLLRLIDSYKEGSVRPTILLLRQLILFECTYS